MTLFCFPYGGGGSRAYAELLEPLPPWVTPVTARLPGRESARRQPALTDVGAMADLLLPGVVEAVDRPFVFYGHSLGARVAYEAVHRLADAGRPLPAALCVSGAPAPALGVHAPCHDQPRAEFLRTLRAMGGVAPEVLADEELCDYVLPVIRADMRAAETYRPPRRTPLRTPVTALAGRDDPRVPVEHVRRWCDEAGGGFRFTVFEGGHFFFRDHPSEVAAVLDGLLREVAGD
ncbi:thioesterase II family protein [Streptomyces huiliensis]|uniref:thioesterase II family protein n=1 Tax=Streptomyces huiliensis TaxID=2876027 RepID=UPI001CBAAF52|nr:alpha/beta fold hydrolase [Streptomyces huiliensis]MBZ4320910.1 alpha/beta fold hydrolase [Streptomyces huiliensis]